MAEIGQACQATSTDSVLALRLVKQFRSSRMLVRWPHQLPATRAGSDAAPEQPAAADLE
jgi:hypothetical protein